MNDATIPKPPAADGGPRVLVSDRQASGPGTGRADALASLASLAARVLATEGAGQVELSLSFVDPSEIEDVHVRYMDEPGPTDVLSFPMDEDDGGAGAQALGGAPRLIGDVIVCPAVAAANNPSDPEGELRLLVVHGVLHLLGYDHEDDAERAAMWAKQEAYAGVRVP